MTRQLWFDLTPQDGAYGRESFCEGRSNAQARMAINRWRSWGNGALMLVGPKGCGKSHLASLWLDMYGGQTLPVAKVPLGLTGNVVVENLEAGMDEEGLFHLMNRAMGGEAKILMTSRLLPRKLPVNLGDLRSRLIACEMAQVDEPDDEVLGCILRKLFKDRAIRANDRVVNYLIHHMQRSSAAALAIVEALNARSLAEGRAVKVPLAKEVLESLQEEPGLLAFMEERPAT